MSDDLQAQLAEEFASHDDCDWVSDDGITAHWSCGVTTQAFGVTDAFRHGAHLAALVSAHVAQVREELAALRSRAEGEIADARLAGAMFAESDSGVALAAQQAREDAWKTVLALLPSVSPPEQDGGA